MIKPLQINSPSLHYRLQQNEILLVDVRKPAEHRAQSIPGAQNIPLSQLSQGALPLSQEKPWVVYCQSGMRSQQAQNLLQSDFPQASIWNLSGGIAAWKKAGLPIKQTGPTLLPLNQQVQILLGGLILLGTGLGFFIQPAWFLMPAIIGLGLLNAGVSGWCGMAKLVAKMPWNRG